MPDEADESPDEHADRRDDQAGGAQAFRPGSSEAETRNRQECYVDLRVADSKEKFVTARRVAAEEQAAAEKWDKTAEESRWMWSEYQRRWPHRNAPEQIGPGRTDSWSGDGDSYLSRADNDKLKQHVTGSPIGNGIRSRPRCVRWKAKTGPSTWSASSTAAKAVTA